MNEWRFGENNNGDIISAYQIGSDMGFQAVILNLGATLQSFRLPNGQNITLGFDTPEGYETDKNYIGRLIGPNTNRIARGKYEIDGTTYLLPNNDGAYNLHSGPFGFDTQIWSVERVKAGLILRYTSLHGENGFPGNVTVELKISLLQNRLRLDMEAETDRATPMNLTWHPYWNLSSIKKIDGHDLHIESNSITNLDSFDETPVIDSRYDFRAPLPLGSVQLDSNYKNVKRLRLRSQHTTMTVTSSLPDMQVYTGEGLPQPREGVAIEPQFRPNDINFAQSSLLRPGGFYSHWIEYCFETAELED